MPRDNEFLIPIEGGDDKKVPYIALSVYYSKGGINYATYRTEKRGIYISASPIKVEETGTPGLIVRSFMAFTGIKQLVEETKRKNDKQTDALFAEAVEDYKAKRGPAWILVNHVLESNGLVLKVDPAPVENFGAQGSAGIVLPGRLKHAAARPTPVPQGR